ncbi:3-deoxy-7-phosphoheptulonate synthase [Entomophthora muscae]|nr:3-deoxy-7-phosphoheptulonate synthase [Entomophthora muscae]
MSLVLLWGARVPVIRVARMAGQYAKPRSSPIEKIDGQEYPSFRGDNVNGFELDQREPDPERLVQAYFHSAATLNYVRSIINSGFADLNKPHEWDLSHVRCGAVREEYQQVVNQLSNTLDFMKTIKVIGGGNSSSQSLRSVDMFMSHESLMLDYESSLTRCLVDPNTGEKKWYNTSGHFLWVGDRTRQLDCAHIEYLSGIANPLGIKVGPTTDAGDLILLLEKLNPKREEGRITLITRFGFELIEKCLSTYIKAVQESGHPVVWVCDPMHGNTEMSSAGVKTRHFANIMGEVGRAFRIHSVCGSKLNGVHFELTGDSVTECVGGSMELEHHQLNDNYQTYCDPRLNYEQSLDMAFLIAKYYQRERTGIQEL